MNFVIEKNKIPQNRSYPFKSSILKNVLESEFPDFEGEIQLVYYNTICEHPKITAQYWLPNRNVGHYRFYITADAVRNIDKRNSEARMNIIIPQLIEWMKEIHNAQKYNTQNKNMIFRAQLLDIVINNAKNKK